MQPSILICLIYLDRLTKKTGASEVVRKAMSTWYLTTGMPMYGANGSYSSVTLNYITVIKKA